jgi:hypothetical protein
MQTSSSVRMGCLRFIATAYGGRTTKNTRLHTDPTPRLFEPASQVPGLSLSEVIEGPIQ